ncbi:MAG: LON peptidase substrate-binding domain-containing protein [Proteobacteria bacterium]|nr:LON peptidase substrate-binding domain-containing protein [Pseudomonadota bacterium]MCP4916460.1 LON peptidase substrate-binding domain-containing protein [Pseudomonadota bacterium]
MDQPTRAQLENLPVFPLPGLVFFPGSLLPLHVFEARYRAMVSFCVARDMPMAVGRIAEGHEHEQPGDPPVFDVMGVGRVARHQELPDGRFNVVLGGVTRVRLVQELDKIEGYRRFSTELLLDRSRDPSVAAAHLATIRACTLSLAGTNAGAAKAIGQVLERQLAPARAADALASVLFGHPDERQELLENLEVNERLERVADRVVELVAG